jgi:uncharacterized protein
VGRRLAADERRRLRAGRDVSPSVLELGFLAVAAVAGGAVNGVAGGGTLITLPALTAVGIPGLNANVTNTVALVPGFLGGATAQRVDLSGQRQRVVAASVPALVGGLSGAGLLLWTGTSLFGALVPWLILGATALLAAEPWLKKAGAARLDARKADAHARVWGVGAAAFAGAVYGGYFGAGLGIILLALFSLSLPESSRRVNALKQTVSFSPMAQPPCSSRRPAKWCGRQPRSRLSGPCTAGLWVVTSPDA